MSQTESNPAENCVSSAELKYSTLDSIETVECCFFLSQVGTVERKCKSNQAKYSVKQGQIMGRTWWMCESNWIEPLITQSQFLSRTDSSNESNKIETWVKQCQKRFKIQSNQTIRYN